ncbi:MAG: ABC transporter permease [Phycisphaerales bacterium]|nr:ABC transporter permease [Phycisphaerales bacterium]
MNIRERLAQLNRLQRSRMFKIIATVVIAALAIAAGGAYLVDHQRQTAPMIEDAALDSIRPEEPPKDATLTKEQQLELAAAKSRYDAAKATQRTINDILRRKADPTHVLVFIAAAAAIATGVVWLGLGLTGLALLCVVSLIVWPLRAIGLRLGESGNRLVDWSSFIAALSALAFSFFVLMELARLALSASHPVTAIARNVINEAVRMKVSLVFIVLLIFMLAALPGLLDSSTQLRYRVQSFMQYGTGGSFWIIALLVLFLGVGSVAFEQRDKVIWQTMTKPVAAWQYLLGKWLGVVTVAAVLLAVSSTGVFLFVEYLRNQNAVGEKLPYVAVGQAISEDRLVLETQVLSARTALRFQMPELSSEEFAKAVQSRLEQLKASDPVQFQDTPTVRRIVEEQILADIQQQYLNIGPGQERMFTFTGLEDVQKKDLPLTLRYKVSIGADDPRETARVTFGMINTQPRVQEVPLGQAMTIPISPASIEDGKLDIVILNGDAYRRMEGDPGWSNNGSMAVEPDGIQVSFPVGSYRANFLRVAFVLWLKLALLAMIAIVSATFLSFSVASMVAFGTFLIAESAGFLNTSLEYFGAEDAQGKFVLWKAIIRFVAVPIGELFRKYSDLAPTASLVDGKIVDWVSVIQSGLWIFLVCGALYALGVFVFKNRELATYSGQ